MSVLPIARSLVCAVLLLGWAPGLARAAATPASASREIEAKVALEASLEKRLQTVLQRVLGTEDVIVMVTVETLTASEAAESEILPGVPVKETLAGEGSPASLTMIKSVSADVLVDQSLSDADLELVRKTADDILAVKPQRGDRVSVRKMNLRRPKSPAEAAKAAGPPTRDMLGSSWLVSGLWLLLVFLAVVLVYTRFLKPLLNVMREMIALQASVAQKPAAAAPPPAEAAPAAATVVQAALQQSARPEGGEGGPEALPFSFLEERHLPMLKVLMRSMDSRMAAVLVQYIPSALASQVLLQMAPGMRQQVVKQMSKVVQLQEKDVKAIEHDVRTRIEYLMGGEEKLASILESSPTSLQEEVLRAVADEDQNLSARLSHRMVLIDDIGLLESNELKILTRRIPVQSLAGVLKSNEALRSQLLPKLTGGLAAWLTQEIDLSTELPPEALDREQKKVLAALAQLVHEGKITLKKTAGDAGAASPESDSVQVLDLGLTAPPVHAPAAAAPVQAPAPIINVSVAAPPPAPAPLPPKQEEPKKGPEPEPAPKARVRRPAAEVFSIDDLLAEKADDPLDMGFMPPGTQDNAFDDLDFSGIGDLPGGHDPLDLPDIPQPPREGTS